MKVTLTSTSKIVILKPGLLSDGLPARIWVGETESGVKVHAFITRIAVAKDQDTEQFERELQQCETPSVEIQAIPRRLIID
ncbi:hypothetical protein [uncultured Sunxiuqinia sp.]|uniref:hypothetical protein n=1 Tax=uncultured Sunxiuqinia sp. TaxID=1573825 RepID=UPI002639E274|nr:hypothetical protein [uncultured Sunxiuqinia sp.]